MKKNKTNMKTEVIDAYTMSGSTGVLTVQQIKEIAKKAQEQVHEGKNVTISMDKISSMSLEASTALRTSIIEQKKIAKNVVIMGSTPYVRQVIAYSMKREKKK